MCVVIVKKGKAKLSDKVLEACWDTNPHGGGFAFAKDDKIAVFKSMKKEEFLSELRTQLDNYPELTFLIHMRIKTAGNISKLNTHPFVVNKDVVFAHNGHIPGMPESNKISDTNFFNKLVLSRMNLDIGNSSQLKLIELAIGRGNKLGFLHSSGDFKIANESEGNWIDGSWFSNCYHENSYASNDIWYMDESEYNELGITKEEAENSNIEVVNDSEWKSKSFQEFDKKKMKEGI